MMNNNFILDEFQNPVTIHSKDDFNKMREAGELASTVLDYITPFVKEGVTTLKLDMLCHNFIISKGAIPAPLNIKAFPNQFAPL